MFLGIDLGTSGVKVVLVAAGDRVVDQATMPLSDAAPRPLWREQDPADWWNATDAAVRQIGARHDLSAVRGIGLAGQMHGAVLLDAAERVLRPAILWNDGRSGAACQALETAEPRSRAITGNRAMPGFTAPKLRWLREHETAVFAATRLVLLPKDWLRLVLTGEAISDMSDAAGTLWLDTGARRWSPAMLAATGLTPAQMPRLVEGSAPGGALRAELAAAWGMRAGTPVAGGAGDNAAAAIGIGCVAPGQAFLSLGTSGVVFVADGEFLPDPERGVHAFCHALPGRWHRMSVILSAAASLGWFARMTGVDEATLLGELGATRDGGSGRLVFLPYLSGERTPYNDPTACGVFFGIDGDTSRADLTRAVLEGVAFALADGLDVLGGRQGGSAPEAALSLIGGGARAGEWGRILAAALGRTLVRPSGAEVGPAIGAARLARLAIGEGDVASVCTMAPMAERWVPEADLADRLAPRRALFRSLYPALQERFSGSMAGAEAGAGAG